MNNIFPFEQALQSLGTKLYTMLSVLDEQTKAHTQEIRLRAECKICLRVSNELKTLENLPKTTNQDIKDAFESICGYSVYAHQNDIANGFVTVYGGHRAGVCGRAVVSNGCVTMLRDISSINLRIARDYPLCSMPFFEQTGCLNPCGLLVAGAPMSGKTTFLRSAAAMLSSGRTGRRYAVLVLDERGEIAAVRNGTAQYESVLGCDIISGCPKDKAISFALRSMSPEVIICDEIGTEEEASAVSESFNSGVAVIASVHGGDIQDLISRPTTKMLLETGAFKYAVMLSRKPLSIEKIIKTEDLLNESSYLHTYNHSLSGGRERSENRHKTQMRIA